MDAIQNALIAGFVALALIAGIGVGIKKASAQVLASLCHAMCVDVEEFPED